MGIAYLINIGYFVVSGGGAVSGIIAFVQYAITAFIQTWLFWFMFAKREPACCCFCVVCIEDWKPMHLVAVFSSSSTACSKLSTQFKLS